MRTHKVDGRPPGGLSTLVINEVTNINGMRKFSFYNVSKVSSDFRSKRQGIQLLVGVSTRYLRLGIQFIIIVFIISSFVYHFRVYSIRSLKAYAYL